MGVPLKWWGGDSFREIVEKNRSVIRNPRKVAKFAVPDHNHLNGFDCDENSSEMYVRTRTYCIRKHFGG